MENPKQPLMYKENKWSGDSLDEIKVENVIFDTKERVRSVLREIKEDVEAGKYGMVLGIDASGRVPALLLANTIKYQTEIETRFVAGANIDRDEYKKRISELTDVFTTKEFLGNLNDKEVLIIDDIIASGRSLELVCTALKELGIPYQVVALGFENTTHSISDLEDLLGSKIIIGKTGTPLDDLYPEIYGKHQMSGVKKGVGVHSESISKIGERLSNEGLINTISQDTAVLQRTRELISLSAKKLAQEIGWE